MTLVCLEINYQIDPEFIVSIIIYLTFTFSFPFISFSVCTIVSFFFCLLGACQNSIWLKVPQSK